MRKNKFRFKRKTMSSKNYSFFISMVMVFSFLVASQSLAITNDSTDSASLPTPPEVTIVYPQKEAVDSEIKTTKKLKFAIQRGSFRITERLSSLNILKKKLSSSGLADDQKEKLNGLINDRYDKLVELQNKLKAEKKLDNAKKMAKSVFDDFRIYAIFIPQINLEKNLYIQDNHAKKLLEEVYPKMQASLDQAKLAGENIDERQKTLNDSRLKVAGVRTKIVTLLAKVETLKPADYPSQSQTKIGEIRVEIKNIALTFRELNSSLRAVWR